MKVRIGAASEAIYYDFDGETATVVAVLDCRQDPASIKAWLI